MSDAGRQAIEPAVDDQEPALEEEAELEVDVDAEAADAPDDAGEDADVEGEEGGERPAQDVAPPRQPGRANREIVALRRRAQQAEARVADFERQLQQVVNQQRQPTAAERAEEERREAEALEMMTPAQQARYFHDKSRKEMQAELQQTRMVMWDQSDRQQYESLLAQDPAYRRYDEQVEELRKQAPGVSRRILLATAIGMRALEQKPAAKTRAARNGAASAERHAAQPSRARGDVAAPRNRAGDDLEERLRGQAI